MAMNEAHANGYYVAPPSPWPPLAAAGAFLLLGGFALWLHGYGPLVSAIGAAVVVFVAFRWFGAVIGENRAGVYNAASGRSFRYGMMWFIFSEVMFFSAFFGALFYLHFLAAPWLGGEGAKGAAHLLWPNFVFKWPLLVPPNPSAFTVPKAAMGPLGIPTINTAVLMSSGVTVILAHRALLAGRRRALAGWLAVTIALGLAFVALQAHEYRYAYLDLDLTLHSGVYGSTFFLLTGFHGLHVILGATVLTVILARVLRGDFSPDDHFAFKAASWYWHFVDAVWVGLYLLVYWW
ncbi:cytochrome c oxidase subunit 3 [Rhodoblastus sp.]|uniref:cytochrome c oxidase subunit 3 n=2 Tax=Rhodoblastus sp. TaxID=1962975 RepID=UPI003FD8BA43